MPLIYWVQITLFTALLGTQQISQAKETNEIPQQGKKIYNYYCYQCHGYAGNAETLASTFLEPKPRNFTATDPERLSRERMTTAVTHGRAGTAMVSFTDVLTTSDIEAVVSFIRSEFMQGEQPDYKYHTAENGWENHERYTIAFPFANGEIALDTPWETLTPAQKEGKHLFMKSCISCHDRAVVKNEGEIWELRPLSYPRKHYTHTQSMDGLSGASPYAVHDKPPSLTELSPAAERGKHLFQQNCAFCHAADGTGRNWIGRFLEPHPRDLTKPHILQMGIQKFIETIKEGLPGTSMPAWKNVLSDSQIGEIFTYLEHTSPASKQYPSVVSEFDKTPSSM